MSPVRAAVWRRRGRRAGRVALLAAAAALGFVGVLLAVFVAALAWWSREAPENPYDSPHGTPGPRTLHDPWDFYCDRRIHGEPYRDSARCPVCRPGGAL